MSNYYKILVYLVEITFFFYSYGFLMNSIKEYTLNFNKTVTICNEFFCYGPVHENFVPVTIGHENYSIRDTRRVCEMLNMDNLNVDSTVFSKCLFIYFFISNPLFKKCFFFYFQGRSILSLWNVKVFNVFYITNSIKIILFILNVLKKKNLVNKNNYNIKQYRGL